MSIITERQFLQKVSPFLRKKMDEAEEKYGIKSKQYQDIARQFVRDDLEKHVSNSDSSLRHYDADMHLGEQDEAITGMERLYKRTMLLELTTSCFAHCRWCLRKNYHRFTLSKKQIRDNIALLSTPLAQETVREILITGGDPLISPQRLDYALKQISNHAPHIEIVRIGTRIFTSNPEHIDSDIVDMFTKHGKAFRIEIGTQINSPVEFWPESIEAMKRLQDCGVVMYNQHPLLKGVNDDVETLAELYDNCRRYAVESHYLFHCVPMIGMDHHRTSIHKGLELIRAMTSGGYFSGRAKPHYTCMTDVGKIVLYQGTVLEKDFNSNKVLLQSAYKWEERKQYNPGFKLTASMQVNNEGYLQVWYLDGNDR